MLAQEHLHTFDTAWEYRPAVVTASGLKLGEAQRLVQFSGYRPQLRHVYLCENKINKRSFKYITEKVCNGPCKTFFDKQKQSEPDTRDQ